MHGAVVFCCTVLTLSTCAPSDMPCLPYICRGRKARQQRQHFIFHQTTGQEWGVVRKDLQEDFVTTDLKVSDAADTGVVGGHADAFTKNELGRISKVADPTELEFYEAASRGLWPSRFLPAYYGVAEAAENEARTIAAGSDAWLQATVRPRP